MKSKLYPYCLMRWELGAWSEEQLTTAVLKKLITEEEKTEIMTQQQQTA
ncbi:XkdX family protein [Brevibacillus borstelensis]|nr:XkdX family protein [Brevibacillus borstelensis]